MKKKEKREARIARDAQAALKIVDVLDKKQRIERQKDHKSARIQEEAQHTTNRIATLVSFRFFVLPSLIGTSCVA